MAINLDDRYPGRANGKTLDYPQGSFKNRTSPTSKDGTYLEQDWANDQLAFFQSLMSSAGMSANGAVDTARSSQYFDALVKTIRGQAIPGATFAEVDALTADEGPIIVTDHGGAVYVWDGTKYAPLIADETYAGAMKRTTTALAQALADDATALTPKKLADAFKGANQSLAANGYRKDPGGLILQWGNSGVVNGSTNATITLPITFPNAGLFGLASVYNTTNVNNGAPIVMSVSTTTIVVRNSNGTTSVPGIFWMALGY